MRQAEADLLDQYERSHAAKPAWNEAAHAWACPVCLTPLEKTHYDWGTVEDYGFYCSMSHSFYTCPCGQKIHH